MITLKNFIEILNSTIWLVCVGGFFQVTPSNFPLFVSFKGILSKFSYVEQNPYYRLFCELGVLCYLTYRNSWRCFKHELSYILNNFFPIFFIKNCRQELITIMSSSDAIRTEEICFKIIYQTKLDNE